MNTPVSVSSERSLALVNRVKEHAGLVDAAFALMVFAFASIDVAGDTAHESQRAVDPLTYLLLAGQTLPFIIRRRMPISAMYTMVGSLSLYWILDYPAGSDASGLVAIYAAVLYGTRRPATWIHAAVAATIMTVSASLLAGGFFVDETGFSPFVVISVAALHTVAAAFGEVMHQRKLWLADLQDRASRAEAAVETTARLAVVEERTRIAREMHDVVAHGISVISVQAAAGQEVALTDPDRAVSIFSDIEYTGREALTEMRRMLGVLRSDGAHPDGLTPQPALRDLDDAIAHCVAAGLPCELTISGEPQRLAAGIELAVYRIVQEALTNALKHGGDSTEATVSLRYEPTVLNVTVTDTGRGAVSSLTSTGSSNGILGMRERVEAYRGDFSAGPRAGGGYEVRARFPLDEADALLAVRSAGTSTPKDMT
ncbi:MAG: two-component sensor histidine kinase [Acidimicrobiales bacterium]|nr:MAG: two-component sensor histidine kinase [Acidimicrobiales bacterium]